MDNPILKKLLPHIAAYIIMALLSIVFFLPYFTSGKTLGQGDNVRAEAMQTEQRKFHKETGEWPLWTNSMFGGMPVYQILGVHEKSFIRYPFYLLLWQNSVKHPAFVCLLAMFCCYLLLITLAVDWRIALMGAIGYGLSTYNMDLAEAGHSTKMAAMAVVPGVFAGALMVFRERYLMGVALFTFFIALNIYANHLQITFYMFLTLGILGLVQIIYAVKDGKLPHLMKAAAILIVGSLIAVACSTTKIWSTQEYAAETIRGKTELKSKLAQDKGDGLDKSYIFAWSYGIAESFTLIIPNFMGGGASHHFRGTKMHDQVYRNVINNGGSKKQAERQVAAFFYWGDQPFVGTAIYFGIVLIFCFFMGMMLVDGPLRAWLLASALFLLTISWGGNFFFNHFLVDYVPFFNKFRAVSMALGLSQLAIIILGMLGVSKLFSKEISIERKKRALYVALGITGGLCVIGFLVGNSLDMTGRNDGQVGNLVATLMDDRAAILRSDVLRSLLLIAMAGALVYFYLQGKLKALYMVILLALLSVGDVLSVNKRIIFAEKYETKREKAAASTPSPADQQIMADPDPHYRVADYARGTFYESVEASKFHKSIGGYHAAKLMRYQEVATKYLTNPQEYMHILGMLNTKYILFGKDKIQVSGNPKALGNAWFVKSFQLMEDGDSEINGLAKLDPANQALIQKKYAKPLDGFNLRYDSTATIKLTSYHPDHMVYEYTASSDQLAVFSEMYYPPSKGWNAYIDGQKTESIMKANYLLRAMKLPAGQNKKLEMKFEPASIKTGNMISMLMSALVVLGFLGCLIWYFRKNELPDADYLTDIDVAQTQKKVKATTSKIKKTVSKGDSDSGKKGKKQKKKGK